jgi:hypothetical protein
MAHEKAKTIVSNALDFHQDLTDLLKKYDAHPEDGKFQLTTADLTYTGGSISNCRPECLMQTPVHHPDGTTTIDVWCSC